jgi:ubiquinone/menaquinone biosynthesis C-methylase UbiE
VWGIYSSQRRADDAVDMSAAADPGIPDWRAVELPDSWPDQLTLRRPAGIWRWLRCFFGARQRIELPAGLPGCRELPRYVLQGFHNLPNGNYSKRITRSYIVGFDRVMLGRMKAARRRLAEYLAGSASALDVGTGGGRTAAALRDSGVADVWGIDPSPYMLQHAAADRPDVRFVQGLAEKTGFPDQRFDAVAVCFVLHEIPVGYLARCFTELRRILKPGGRLAICEPSSAQLKGSFWSQLRRHGFAGAYFHLLARVVHEPFVRAWHRADVAALLARAGLELVSDANEPPVRFLVARRSA